jgi:3-oxoacyl-[acyl-carrier protein] reductase
MKRIFITGASSEIGLELIELLIKFDVHIIAHYNSNAQQLKQKDYKNLDIIRTDFSNEIELNCLINTLNNIDVFINISGKELEGLFTDFDNHTYELLTKINLLSPIAITKKIIPDMIKNKYGKIVFVTSIWGEIGASNEVMYSALKGAQNTFVKSLAKELAPSNINVNAVSPGAVDTKMLRNLSDEDIELLISDIPLKRLATPLEVAETIKFLIDDRSNYITGQIMAINGGWNI